VFLAKNTYLFVSSTSDPRLHLGCEASTTFIKKSKPRSPIRFHSNAECRSVCRKQGCQMVCFQTKNSNLGKFWRALDGKMLIYFRTFWNSSWTFGIFYYHLVLFVFICYIFPGFGIMYHEKSGNPGRKHETRFFFFSVRT
jgi:hypothetical protein